MSTADFRRDFVMDSRWLTRTDLLSPAGHRLAIDQLISKLIWNMSSDDGINFCLRPDGSFYFGTFIHRSKPPTVLSNPCQLGVSDPGRRVSLMKFYSFWRNSTHTLSAFGVIPPLIIRRCFRTKSLRGHKAFVEALCENESFYED